LQRNSKKEELLPDGKRGNIALTPVALSPLTPYCNGRGQACSNLGTGKMTAYKVCILALE